MTDKALLNKFPMLKTCSKVKLAQLFEHFRTAPDWVLDSCSLELVPPNSEFIREGLPVDYIYYIVDGIIKAIDYHVYGVEYDFAIFTKNYAMGGMETLMNMGTYRTTLKTVERCMVLKLSRDNFEKWMMADSYALRYETKMMGEYLLEQCRLAREYLFLPGPERLMKVLVMKYERNSQNNILCFNATRQDLVNETGLVIKTISRAIKFLTDEGLIIRRGKRIEVNYEQYVRMKAIIEGIVAPLKDEETE